MYYSTSGLELLAYVNLWYRKHIDLHYFYVNLLEHFSHLWFVFALFFFFLKKNSGSKWL